MRRLFWLSVGAAAGASGTIWTQRRVREHLDNFGPEQVVVVAGKGARAIGRTVAAAVGEGRSAMADRETELRRRLHAEPGSAGPDTPRLRAHRAARPAPAWPASSGPPPGR